MENPRARRALWAAVALAMVCGLLWSLVPLASTSTTRFKEVPLEGAGFQGWEVPLTEAEKSVLGRVDMIHRRYLFGPREVYVTIIDGTKDRHAVHDPRYCFQGAGRRMLEKRNVAVPGGEATVVRTTFGGEAGRAQAMYWFSNGEKRHSSVPRYWLQTTFRRITLGLFGAEPVMVVLQAFGAEQPDLAESSREVFAALGEL